MNYKGYYIAVIFHVANDSQCFRRSMYDKLSSFSAYCFVDGFVCILF